MKTELKAKFLQHMIQRKQGDKGFTLIELLVVIIIIGVLSAIALPSFLNQAAKARAAEAKSNVGSMNRAQQASYLENQAFSSVIQDLGLSMINSTDNFTYSAVPGSTGITNAVTNLGTSKKSDIKSYVGGTFYIAGGAGTEGATSTILCESLTTGAYTTAPASSTSCTATAKEIK